MAKLIAKSPILFKNHQYMPGDELPNVVDAQAWVDCGSAVWEEGKGTKKKRPKAKPLAARAGVEGLAQPATGAEADLVGVVPSPKARGAAPAPRKRAPKSKA